MSLFQSVPQEVSVKKQSSILNDPILYKSFRGDIENCDVYLLVEKPLSDNEIQMFVSYFRNNKVYFKYSIISSVLIPPGNLFSNITDFYSKNRSDLENIIKPKSKIISMGRAIYSITQTDDILESDFVDLITDKTYFYSPDLKSYVWPVPEYFKWMGKDNFEKKWFWEQLKNALKFEVPNQRIKSHKRTIISDTTKFFNDYMNEPIVAWDIETDSLDWKVANIGCISFAFNSYEGFLLNWSDINKRELEDFLRNKKQILMNGKYDCKCLVRNGIDREALHIDYDIWQMQHIWKEDNVHNSLKSGAWRHSHFGGYDRELENYKKKNKIKNYLDIPLSIMKDYAIDDAILTFKIYEEVQELIHKMDRKYPMNNGWSLWRYYTESVMPSVNTFLDVELNGLDINYSELKNMSEESQKEIEEVEKEVYKSFGVEKSKFNIYSTEQLSKLIDSLGWKIEDRGKNKQPLTNEACLERWKKQGHKEAELLLKLRGKTSLMNTFVGKEEDNSGFFQYIIKEDDKYRVYPTILPMVAESGRSKHRDPNTANIPAHGDGARFIRRMFCPPSEEFGFLSADASGLQLRIAAILSRDPLMLDIFKNQNGDMHSLTAAAVFGNILYYKEEDGEINIIKGYKEGYKKLGFKEFTEFRKFNEDVKEYRFKSKALNFSAVFGAVHFTIKTQSIDPEWTEEACEEYIELNNLQDRVDHHRNYYEEKGYDNKDIEFHSKTLTVAEDVRNKFFDSYKGLEVWIEQTREIAKAQGFVRSIYGAFRRLPYLMYNGKDTDKSRYANLLNICLNSPVQNVESVLMNRWLTNFNKWAKENNKKSYIFAAIHDAGEFMFYKDEVEEGYKFLKEDFEYDFPEYEGVPMELEGNFADYWGTYKTDNWELWDMGKEL